MKDLTHRFDDLPLLTGEEVAQRLGVSKPHVYKLWDTGRLPCILIPGMSKRKMRRITAEVLEEWIAQHTHANGRNTSAQSPDKA